MKGNLTLKILQTLKEVSVEGVELCEAIVTAGYGASRSQIARMQEDIRARKLRSERDTIAQRQHVRNFQRLVYKLKAQGFLKREDKDNSSFFCITAKGKSKLVAMESQLKHQLPKISYLPSPNSRPIIISFDIPERLRKQRGWIRDALKRLGLKMVHKSVWIGMVKIPSQFLDDLKKLNLLDYVEIFEVGKTGTLRHIVQHATQLS